MAARSRPRATARPRPSDGAVVGLSLAGILVAAAGCPPAPAVVTDFDSGWSVEPDVGAPIPPAPRQPLLPAAARPRWSEAEQVPTLSRLPGRGPSEHLSGDSFREVLINEAASNYARPSSRLTLPAGAILLQRQLGPAPEHALIGYFAMHKRTVAGASPKWQFLVLDSQLRVATAESPASCQRCHSEAPNDSWFGPPTPNDSPAP